MYSFTMRCELKAGAQVLIDFFINAIHGRGRPWLSRSSMPAQPVLEHGIQLLAVRFVVAGLAAKRPAVRPIVAFVPPAVTDAAVRNAVERCLLPRWSRLPPAVAPDCSARGPRPARWRDRFNDIITPPALGVVRTWPALPETWMRAWPSPSAGCALPANNSCTGRSAFSSILAARSRSRKNSNIRL